MYEFRYWQVRLSQEGNHNTSINPLLIILESKKLFATIKLFQAPNLELNTRWNLRRVISAPTYDLLFTLLVPEPELLTSKWDIERAIEEHLRPLLHDLDEVVTFNIKSQVLYLTGLSLTPMQQVNLRETKLRLL